MLTPNATHVMGHEVTRSDVSKLALLLRIPKLHLTSQCMKGHGRRCGCREANTKARLLLQALDDSREIEDAGWWQHRKDPFDVKQIINQLSRVTKSPY